MCIIIAKPKGVEIPSEEVVRKGYKKNDDGAGIGFYDGHNIVIKKDFPDFSNYYQFIADNITKDMPTIMHMRIRTSGKTDAGGRHPFPISNDEDALRAKEIRTDMAAAHNGVFSDFSFTNTDLNDSQLMVANVLFPGREELVSSAFRFLLNKYVSKESSRLSLLNKEGIYLFGGWKEKDGLLFSNSLSVPYTQMYSIKDAGGKLIKEAEDIEDMDRKKQNIYGSTYGGYSGYGRYGGYKSLYGKSSKSSKSTTKTTTKTTTTTKDKKKAGHDLNVDYYEEYDPETAEEARSCDWCHKLTDVEDLNIGQFEKSSYEFILCKKCIGLR